MNRSIPTGECVAREWSEASVGVTLEILHDCFYGVDANREKWKSKNICIKNVSFGELLTAWHEKKSVWEPSAKAEPLEIWFPSAFALRYLRTCLHKALKDRRSRKRSPLSSALQLPSPPPPFSYVFFQKDLMHIHTRLFISGFQATCASLPQTT